MQRDHVIVWLSWENSSPSCGSASSACQNHLRGDVAGNLPRPVPGNGPDRAGGSDRDQRVRWSTVAQNPPPAVVDDFVSRIVEESDAIRLEVNSVCPIRLDRAICADA